MGDRALRRPVVAKSKGGVSIDDTQRAAVLLALRGSGGDWRPMDPSWFNGTTAVHKLVDEKVIEHRSFVTNTDGVVRFEIRWHPDYLEGTDG